MISLPLCPDGETGALGAASGHSNNSKTNQCKDLLGLLNGTGIDGN